MSYASRVVLVTGVMLCVPLFAYSGEPASDKQQQPTKYEQANLDVQIQLAKATDKLADLTFWLVIFGALQIVVFAVSTAITWRAANAAKKSADIAADAARSHVFIKIVTTGGMLNGPNGTRELSCLCYVINHGSVAAVPEVFFLKSNLGLEKPLHDFDNSEYVPAGGMDAAKSVRFELRIPMADAHLVEEMRSRELLISGHIFYKEPAGQTRREKYFEFVYRPPPVAQFSETGSRENNRRT